MPLQIGCVGCEQGIFVFGLSAKRANGGIRLGSMYQSAIGNIDAKIVESICTSLLRIGCSVTSGGNIRMKMGDT